MICGQCGHWNGHGGAFAKDANRSSGLGHVGWILRSFALHGMKRPQEAWDKLRPAANLFPKLWLIPYGLAGYKAQRGGIGEAQERYMQTMTLNIKEVKRIALDDPDLEPLWERDAERCVETGKVRQRERRAVAELDAGTGGIHVRNGASPDIY